MWQVISCEVINFLLAYGFSFPIVPSKCFNVFDNLYTTGRNFSMFHPKRLRVFFIYSSFLLARGSTFLLISPTACSTSLPMEQRFSFNTLLKLFDIKLTVETIDVVKQNRLKFRTFVLQSSSSCSFPLVFSRSSRKKRARIPFMLSTLISSCSDLDRKKPMPNRP